MKLSQWLLRMFPQSDQRKTDLDAEIASHLRMAAEDRVARGEQPAQAYRSASREFGNPALVKDVTRHAWGWVWLERLVQDLKYAVRQVRKSPGFTITAILTLALGIGANTALFSIVDGVLLHPLPFPHPEELVTVHAAKKAFSEGSISYPNFRDWQRENRTLSAIAVSRGTGFNLTGQGNAEEVRAQLVSSAFFSILGVNPVIGRLFAPDEDQVGRAPVVLISQGLWERKFGSDRGIVGRPLTLDGRNYTVVGVLPASFQLAINNFRGCDLYVPIGQFRNPALTDRAAGLGIHGIARLKPGVTFAQAQADMQQLSQRLAEAYPHEDQGISARLVPFQFAMVRDVKPILLVLMSAVGCVLLIACVNIANLLLARSNARAQEFAVRSALGARHTRLLRQLLTESILLSSTGGLLGFALAAAATRVLLNMLPQQLPRASEIHMSAAVLAFTAVVSLASGILFGLAPAWKILRSNLQETLKERSRGASGTRHRTQHWLVIFQMATALVLLAGAALMVRSLVNLLDVQTGFRPHGVLTFGFQPPPSMIGSSPDAARAYVRAAHQRIAAVPGIQAVSFSWAAVPMSSDDEQQFWLGREPKPSSEDAMRWAIRYIVEPDYLKVMGMPLLKGRFLDASDNEHAPRAAVIDDVFAEKYFGAENPIGKQLHLENFDDPATIVGVVGHINQWGLDSDSASALRAEIYQSLLQLPEVQLGLVLHGMDTLVRSASDPDAVFPAIQDAVTTMNSEQVVYQPQTMDSIIADTLASRRFLMILLGVFAAAALLLASIGMYGVLAYVVGERRKEIGIRMAMGASRGDMLRWVLRAGGRLAVTGAALGLLAALASTPVMTHYSLIYGVPAYDPWVLAAVTALLLLVAMVACYIPARRAASIQPMEALRSE